MKCVAGAFLGGGEGQGARRTPAEPKRWQFTWSGTPEVDDITDTHFPQYPEAWGQGIDNIIAGFFGGMGAAR